jgi:hypothetical protein
MAKEKALRAIRLLESVNEIEKNNFQSYLSTIQDNIKYWKTDSDYQIQKNGQLTQRP